MGPTFRTWYENRMYATPELIEETETVKEILNTVKTIAIVGISRNQHKDSHYVGRYLKNIGYKVIPVNPTAETILGEKAYPDLKSVPYKIDAVDIFRKPKDIPGIVDEALSIDAPVIWLQLGTGVHPEQKDKVKQNGKTLIQNRCMKVDHQFLLRPSNNQSQTP